VANNATHRLQVVRPDKGRIPATVFAVSPHSGRNYSFSFLRSTVFGTGIGHPLVPEDAVCYLLFKSAPHSGSISDGGCRVRFLDSEPGRETSWDRLDRKGAVGRRITRGWPSGLGVIPRVVANWAVDFIQGKWTLDESPRANRRLPYCGAVSRYAAKPAEWTPVPITGRRFLVDCHSISGMRRWKGFAREGLKRAPMFVYRRPFFCAACRHDVVDQIEAAFRGAGFTVTRNTPYCRGHIITAGFMAVRRGQHAVQSKFGPIACI